MLNGIFEIFIAGSLHMDLVKFIIMDWSHRDIKLKKLMDSKEIKTDLMKLLHRYFIPHITKTNGKFGLL